MRPEDDRFPAPAPAGSVPTTEPRATHHDDADIRLTKSFVRMIRGVVGSVSSNQIALYVIGLLVVVLFAMCVGILLVWFIQYIISKVFVLLTTPVDVLKWAGGLVGSVFSRTCTSVASRSFRSYTTLGQAIGLLPLTALQPLRTEFNTLSTPFQHALLPHVGGMLRARKLAQPHTAALQRSIIVTSSGGLGPDRCELFLPVHHWQAMQMPVALVDGDVSSNITFLGNENTKISDDMRKSLEASRTALVRFRRTLRAEPGRTLLSSASDDSDEGGFWLWLRRLFMRTVKTHMLDQLNELERIIVKRLSDGYRWRASVATTSIRHIYDLENSLCEAAGMLRDSTWDLEVKEETLYRRTIDDSGGDGTGNDDSLAPIRARRAHDLATISSSLAGLRVIQASFGHMCQFATADRNVLLKVVQKISSDSDELVGALSAIKKIREGVEGFHRFTNPRAILTEEAEMDKIAESAHKAIKYWEQDKGRL